MIMGAVSRSLALDRPENKARKLRYFRAYRIGLFQPGDSYVERPSEWPFAGLNVQSLLLLRHASVVWTLRAGNYG